MSLRFISATCLVLAFFDSVSLGQAVEQRYPNGSIFRRFKLRDGQPDGKFEEFHETGKLKIRTNYRKGMLDGAYQAFDTSGRKLLAVTYKRGLREGEGQSFESGKPIATHRWRQGALVEYNGKRVGDRSVKQIARELTEIHRRADSASTDQQEQAEAVGRLNAYRYLSGLPYDVTIDPEYARLAQAGSGLLHRIGRLDHNPANPGLPADVYEPALEGTSHSNIYAGASSMSASADAFMNDSDPSNIDRLGHRSWCLNPAMKKTGFGRTEGFTCMWSMDESRGRTAWSEILFPNRGSFPIDYFKPDWAWSVWLHPDLYSETQDFAVEVKPLDEFLRPAPPLSLDTKRVSPSGGYGPGPALIFRPVGVEVAPDRRYKVSITGLKRPNGEPVALEYVVEFVELTPEVVGEKGRPGSGRRTTPPPDHTSN